jgi:hypothetical protein
MHEEPGEEIVGIEELLGGTLRAFVPVACDGSFQLEPFEGQGRTQEVAAARRAARRLGRVARDLRCHQQAP